MTSKGTFKLRDVADLVKQGEGPVLEFKRSTGELKEGLQSLCAFLNAAGGMVLFGVRPDGKVEGQHVTDQTLREIAQALDKFEPPVNLPVERLPVGGSNPLIAGAFHRTGAVEVWGRGTNRVIAACEKHGSVPPTFEDRNGFLIVTFKAQIVAESDAANSETQSAPGQRQGVLRPGVDSVPSLSQVRLK